jgi:hypothetical protein
MKEPWNADISVLKDHHVTALIIDFKERTFEVYVDNELYGRTGGKYEPIATAQPFTNVSPFGQIARGLRRMVTNDLSRWGMDE